MHALLVLQQKWPLLFIDKILDFPIRFYLHISRQSNAHCAVRWPETNGLRDGFIPSFNFQQLVLVTLNLRNSQEALCLITMLYSMVTFSDVLYRSVSKYTHFKAVVSWALWSTTMAVHVGQWCGPLRMPQVISDTQSKIIKWAPYSFLNTSQASQTPLSWMSHVCKSPL